MHSDNEKQSFGRLYSNKFFVLCQQCISFLPAPGVVDHIAQLRLGSGESSLFVFVSLLMDPTCRLRNLRRELSVLA